MIDEFLLSFTFILSNYSIGKISWLPVFDGFTWFIFSEHDFTVFEKCLYISHTKSVANLRRWIIQNVSCGAFFLHKIK